MRVADDARRRARLVGFQRFIHRAGARRRAAGPVHVRPVTHGQNRAVREPADPVAVVLDDERLARFRQVLAGAEDFYVIHFKVLDHVEKSLDAVIHAVIAGKRRDIESRACQRRHVLRVSPQRRGCAAHVQAPLFRINRLNLAECEVGLLDFRFHQLEYGIGLGAVPGKVTDRNNFRRRIHRKALSNLGSPGGQTTCPACPSCSLVLRWRPISLFQSPGRRRTAADPCRRSARPARSIVGSLRASLSL